MTTSRPESSTPTDRSDIEKSEKLGPDDRGPDWKESAEPETDGAMAHADITNGEIPSTDA